ncbi:signal peptidase I [Cryobacterium sp. PH31-AA6]|uniref:signal peptidase I n=1 Tax=Cryobacterium sp. PH31-AA6 TaxID=3046205 RepID=UPI0024BBC78D|nr:signal peptidase I [Cryobacterium sp. PH31-AA6]MDJ0323775.1 signal peptidase I [Cryobacterium sp. PH31-AA6]
MNKKVRRLVTAVIAVMLILAPVALLVSGVLPYRAYVVQTGSMSPTVPPASLVIVEVDKYQVGQVITFRKQDELVTHRLVSVNADGTLTTKGDANTSADPSTPVPADVIGGVIYAPRGLGFWVMYFHNPLTIASLVLWAVVSWLLWPRETTAVDRPPAVA